MKTRKVIVYGLPAAMRNGITDHEPMRIARRIALLETELCLQQLSADSYNRKQDELKGLYEKLEPAKVAVKF